MKYFSLFSGIGGFESGIQNSFLQSRQDRKEDKLSSKEGEHSEQSQGTIRQPKNGRRMKDDGEPSFTLTGQDVHGVAIVRGRPKMPYEPGKRELKYSKYKDTCPTLTENCASGDQKNIVMPQIRRLTPTECERLQSFPDGWTEGISDTQRYKCLGNAITTNVVQAIMERLLNE